MMKMTVQTKILVNGEDAHAGDAVEVGDTPADTVMGRAAGLGLTVGVLRFFLH